MIISDRYFVSLSGKVILENSNREEKFDNIFDEYIVKKGDNLIKIIEKEFAKFGITLDKKKLPEIIKEIANYNHLKNPNLIYAGQKLKIKINLKNNQKFNFPVDGIITSKFGPRLDPFTKTIRFHKGIDIAAPIGTPVKSVMEGEVIFSGWIKGYGEVVIIKNGDIITKYAHNSILLVKKGDYVKRGEIIAKVGKTGRATGPHLHFEVVVNGKNVDPINYFNENEIKYHLAKR